VLKNRVSTTTLEMKNEDDNSKPSNQEYDNVIDYYKCQPKSKKKTALDDSKLPENKKLYSNTSLNKMKNHKGTEKIEGINMKNTEINPRDNVEKSP